MRAELAAAAVVIAAAVIGVRQFEARLEARANGQVAAIAESAAAAPTQASSPYRAGWGEEVRVAASADHQFYVTAAVNDAPFSFLIDTGASFVALRESDARRAGVYANWNDFDRPVRTANGETKAAFVELNRVEIDGIRLENVKAFVLADDQLSVNLLGMSFLARLESVESRGGELVLRG
jgi:aspartyl protease family protein